MVAKIQPNDVFKKHLKIVGYLVTSSVLAYLVSIFGENPEFIYFAPVINYLLFVLAKEIKREGVVQIIKNKVNRS